MSQEQGSRKLTNAPLVYVLAQVRYSPILSMEKFIPHIQEQVRKTFPKFRKVVMQSLVLGVNGQPDTTKVERWEFAGKDGDAGFIVQTDSFVFHTTAYKTFEDFISQFEFALSEVNKEANISLIERIGLRYVDVIEAEEGEELGVFLVPGLAGFPLEKLQVKTLISYMETITTTDEGVLVLKATKKLDGNLLPPDLQPIGLKMDRKISEGRPNAILDFDHYSEQAMEFSIDDVVKKIDRLHNATSSAFWATTTKYAIDRWT